MRIRTKPEISIYLNTKIEEMNEMISYIRSTKRSLRRKMLKNKDKKFFEEELKKEEEIEKSFQEELSLLVSIKFHMFDVENVAEAIKTIKKNYF